MNIPKPSICLSCKPNFAHRIDTGKSCDKRNGLYWRLNPKRARCAPFPTKTGVHNRPLCFFARAPVLIDMTVPPPTPLDLSRLSAGSSSSHSSHSGDLDLVRSTSTSSDSDFWLAHEPLHPVGRGHFGDVTLARVRATRALVAVKAVGKAAATEGCPCLDLTAEATALTELRHPNIVRLIAVWDSPATLFLLLEHAAGGDLLARMRSLPGGVLPVGEARHHSAAVFRAIAFLHRRGYIHRDVKPANVLLSACGEARLADFGLAVRTAGRPLTQIVGTQEFLAPEMVLCGQGEAQGYGSSVDEWGAGLLLFGALYGFNPLQRRTEVGTLAAILRAEWTLPTERTTSPERLAECRAAARLIGRLLVADPARRWTARRCLLDDEWLTGADASDNGEAELRCSIVACENRQSGSKRASVATSGSPGRRSRGWSWFRAPPPFASSEPP